MSTKLTSFLFFDLVLITSCKEKVNNTEEKNSEIITQNFKELEMEQVDDYIAVLPDDVSAMDLYWTFDNNNLRHTDYPLSTIYSFNTKERAWKNHVLFENEGPNGIGLGTGYFYQNKDSIFIFNGYKYTMYLMNAEGEKKYSSSLPQDFTVNLFTTRKVKKVNNFLMIPGSEYLNADNKYTSQAHLLVQYDLENDTYKKMINYPSFYKDHTWKKEQLLFTFEPIKDQLVGSFAVSPEIYTYDLNGVPIKKFYAKSKNIKNAVPIEELDNNSPKANKVLYENGYYTYILWDKYKNVFYRLAYHLPKKLKGKKKYALKDMDLSIIVLDENLKYKGEVFLPEDISGYLCYVDEKGLNLSIKPNFVNTDTEVRAFKTFQLK